MLVSGYTHKGKMRLENQDSFWFDTSGKDALLLVADGMGGHAGGAVASRMAVSRVRRKLCAFLRDPSRFEPGGPRVFEQMRRAVESSNRWLREVGEARQELRGMGTTLVLTLIRHGWLYLGHVGDSRAYLFRDLQLRQLTRDHSVAEQMDLSPEAGAEAPLAWRHVLTQALGAGSEAQPSFLQMPLKPGDQLLLCSDGLSGEIGEMDLKTVMSSPDPIPDKATRMLDLALNRGGRDNITLILGLWPLSTR